MPGSPVDSLRLVGHVFSVSGSQANIRLTGPVRSELIDDMLGKHFALFGSTGVGKSSGVAVILRQVLEMRPDLRIFLIDPHNEYGHSFRDRAQVLNPKNLKLPFWLFNFEETVDVFFRG